MLTLTNLLISKGVDLYVLTSEILYANLLQLIL